MQIQKHLSKKVGDKVYYKYVLVIPNEIMQSSNLDEGKKLKVEVKKGEIKIRKK